MGAAKELVYDGKLRNRPPGASPTVRSIYTLLVAHSEGVTVSSIHDGMRELWSATDAYRGYEQELRRRRAKTAASGFAAVLKIPENGSVAFMESARRWWLQGCLAHMRSSGTARREGKGKETRWFAGERAPREIVAHVNNHSLLSTFDPVATAVVSGRETSARIRREEMKARLLQGLDGPRSPVVGWELVQLAYDYICGR